MADDKKLYFIPIIARAVKSEDVRRAMTEAFDEIRELGRQPDYKEGFRQFLEFARMSVSPSGEELADKLEVVRNAVYRLLYDLATGSFQGNEAQKELLTTAIQNTPEWNAEYEHLVEKAQGFLPPDMPLDLEILSSDRVIGSASITARSLSVGSIRPGRYTVRLSNGRVLWDGEISKEDIIWAFAYPGKDLAMAAETEIQEQEPTRSISLLDGELVMRVFAGLETGRIRIESEKPI